MELSNSQVAAISDRLYTTRMRLYLNAHFPESQELPPAELDDAILQLTHRAAQYKLVLETHLAPYVVTAWVMGLDFDERFDTAKNVLENLELDSGTKAEWLWLFVSNAVSILEDGGGTAAAAPLVAN